MKSVGIQRTNVYRQREPRQEAPENVQLMHGIDKLYTKHPYFSYRRMTSKLQEQGWDVTANGSEFYNRYKVRIIIRDST